MNATGMPAPTRLRLVRSHGDAVDVTLPVPPEGRGLADALELGGKRLNDDQWRSANRCRVVPDGEAWRVVNGSHALVCTLNGVRILPSAAAAIAIGDVLELALLRFLVEPATDAMPVAPATRITAPSDVPGPVPDVLTPSIADAVEFDLCELAFPATPAGTPRMARAGDDPFGVLDIDGAEALPAADPLAELLGEDPAPQRRRDRTVSTTMESGASEDAAPILGGQLSAARREEALFAKLHEEFLRVARDPTQLAGRTDWEGLLTTGGANAPSFEDLVQKGEPFPMVLDILKPRAPIDRVIEAFDPLGQPALLGIGDDKDVLHLFAPELARQAVTAMPSLTRQEHHHLSPDSHIRLGATRPEAPGVSPPARLSIDDTKTPPP